MKHILKSLIPIKIKDEIRNLSIGFLLNRKDELLSKNSNSQFYSQFGEDEIILNYLPEKEGFYIDIGAGRPIRGSNTYALYSRGWTGICIDPIKLNMHLFRSLRPKDIFMNVLIGSEVAIMNFWEFVPYEYSTVVAEIAETILADPQVKLKKVHKKSVKPLRDFAPHITPMNASLLSIDVEGYDLEVLKSNDWERFRPRVICVEEWESHKTNNDTSYISAYLSTYGYQKVAETTVSKIYVARLYLNYLS
jgi:hypothetical protein